MSGTGGRPRLVDAARRDGQVLTRLRQAGPSTCEELAYAVGVKRSLVYLSLRRLRDEGEVRKCATDGLFPLWTAGECPQ